MLATIRSLGVKGIGGYGVSVEVFVSNGLVNFDIVGLPMPQSGRRARGCAPR